MLYAPLPDFGWAPMLSIGGFLVLTVSLPFIIVVECLVFKVMLAVSWRRALGQAFLANLLSALAGLFWLGNSFFYLLEDVYCPGCECQYYFSEACMLPFQKAGVAAILGYLALTLLIEGVVVYGINRPAPQKRWWAALLVANLITYTLMSIYIYTVR